MEAEIAGGGFLEYAEVHGNLFATSRRSLQELLDQDKITLVDVDVQGAKELAQQASTRSSSLSPRPP